MYVITSVIMVICLKGREYRTTFIFDIVYCCVSLIVYENIFVFPIKWEIHFRKFKS